MEAVATLSSHRTARAAVLAGGASRRMGQPKALLPFRGKPLIAHTVDLLRPLFAEIVVTSSQPAFAQAAGLPAIRDLYPGKGPLAGIHAALSHFDAPVFCCACDMPYLNRDFIAYLLSLEGDFDVIAPRINGCFEPLHAIYGPGCRPLFETELGRPRPRGLYQLFAELRLKAVDEAEIQRFDSTLQLFENWNTPGDVAKAGGSAQR